MRTEDIRDIDGKHLLMQAQLGVFLECEKHEGEAIYNNPLLFKLSDDMDMDSLEKAVEEAMHAHPGLFSAVVANEDGAFAMQYQERYAEQKICVREKMTDEELERSKASFVMPFDLMGERLFRVRLIETGSSKYLFMDFHHLIFDGSSLIILIADIEKILKGEEIEPESFTAFDAADAEQVSRQSDAWKSAKAWNLNQFKEIESVSLPDGDLNEKEIRYGKRSFTMDISYSELKSFCKRKGVRGSVLTNAAFGYLLSSLTMKRESVFSTIYNGRRDPRTERTVSMFVKTLPVFCRIEKDLAVMAYLSALGEQLSGSMTNDLYSFAELAEDTGINGDVQFVWHGDLLKYPKEGPFKLSREEVPYIATGIPFSAELLAKDDSLILDIRYHASRYSDTYITRFAQCYNRVLEGLMTQEKLSEVSLLSHEEKQKILALSKGRELSYDENETWLDLFQKNVERTPDKTAVTDASGSFTYGELDRVSDSIAAFLIDRGVKENSFVAVKMGRVKEFYAAVIGIHKAGAAYVPVDPDYPDERISYMIEDSEAKVILTEEAVAEAVGEYTGSKLEELGAVNLATPEHLAYMIYTSGSTGKPKGVVQSHRSLRAFLAWMLNDFHIDCDSVHALQVSFSFDASLQDIFCPLSAGGEVHIFSDELRRDLTGMRDYIEEHGITAVDMPTQIGMALVNQYPRMKLKYLMIGGEKLLPCARTDVTLVNAYGPTEFTDTSSYYVVDQDRDTGDIPIGRPVANTWSFICNAYGNLLPQGMTGELCLCGPQIAEGYWNKKEQTKKSFVPCTFLSSTDAPAGTSWSNVMYRTGDLAGYNEDGELVYRGRIDTQVKLRGFRIEMGEIEMTARRYDGILLAAADVKKDQLVLYFTAKDSINPDTLRNYLAGSLTEYMVPSIYMQLEKMPMTPSGKIDRKHLPEPELKTSGEYIAPSNDAERAVACAMKKVLGVEDDIGALDDFFLFGGDSIKAIRLVSLLREEKYKVSVADIMKQKTVRKIAEKAIRTDGFTISQKPYEGAISDSAIVAYFKDLHAPNPNYYNQTRLFSMSVRADKEILKRAWDALCYQHDLLRAVFDGEKLVVRDANARIEIEEYRTDSPEFGSSDEEDTISGICKNIKAYIQMDKALVRIALIHGRVRDYLYIAVHHLVVDGVSWRILMSDMETAYDMAAKNEEIHLPAKTNTYRDYAEALHRYRDSYALSLEIPYWKRIQDKLEALPFSEGKNYGRRFGHIEVSMDSEDTNCFTRANFGIMKADINDALLAAVCLAVYNVTGRRDISVELEGHGREDLGEPLTTDRTIGWFTSIYPVIFEGLSGDVSRDLLMVKEALHRIPNKGVGYNILRFIEGRESVSFSTAHISQIGFNYLGEMDAEQRRQSGNTVMRFQESSIPTGPDISNDNTVGPDLSFNCMLSGGRFVLSLDYNEASYSEQTAQNIADGILEQMKEISLYLSSCTEAVVTATDIGETWWSREEFEAVMADFASRGEKITRIYPLLPMQEAMLFKHISEPEAFAYRMVSIYEMEGVPIEDQLSRALKRLGQKHEVLRTAIIHEGVSIPRQALVERELGLRMMDVSKEEDPQKAVFKIREDILKDGFDLQRKPLFGIVCAKKDEDHSYLVVAVHHIIVDGWCIRLYLGDLLTYIKEEMDGRQSQKIALNPGRYEAAVREILKKDLYKGQDYWKELLNDYETRAEIPSYGIIPEKERSKQDEIAITINLETTEDFERVCREAGATIGNGIELVWGLILSTFSRKRDVVFGKIVSGRDNAGTDTDDVVGLFINSIPVRLRTDSDTTAKVALKALQEQSAKSNTYDYCPLTKVQEQTYLGSNLLQTILVFENYNSGRTEESPDQLLKTICTREERFSDIQPVVFIRDGSLSLQVSYDTSAYSEAMMRQVLDLFKLCVEQIAASPDKRLSTFELVTEGEKEKILALSKGEDISYDRDETWLDLFFDIVGKMPSKTAVVADNGSYTYEELDKASSEVAAYLLEKGVKENDFVAVRMGRVKEFATAVVGIHRAGAAYVPIDPDYPDERIAYMLEDSGSKEVLTQEKVSGLVGKYPDKGRVNRATPKHRAYMIYTSGSTGRPKGVIQSHRSLRCFLAWAAVFPGLDESSVNGLHTSFSFDVSLHDLFGSLSAGGTLCIMPEEIRRDLPKIKDYIEEHHITAMSMSTQIGMALINRYPDMKLRYCMIGGEKMLPCEKTDIMLINGYGPTEFTIFSNYHVVDQKKDTGNIPIGRAVPNTWSYVCDEQGRLLPLGLVGELCLAGPQIAEGYLGLQKLTSERFVDCPHLQGEKMYRTGDLARYNENGELLCLGRIDTQVKLRGFRIELGEIETVARGYRGIEKTAAEVRRDQLVLYYTEDDSRGGFLDAGDLKAFLASKLTDYMVPSVYMRLDSMPLTPNGKIDRKKLPEPDMKPVGPEESRKTDALDEILLEIIKEAIGIEITSFETPLIHQGMTSITSMMLSFKLSKRFGIEVPSRVILTEASAASLKNIILTELLSRSGTQPSLEKDTRVREEITRAPLSYAQMGVYYDCMKQPASTIYNIPNIFTLPSETSEEDCLRILGSIVGAHPALNSHFEMSDGEVFQMYGAKEEPVPVEKIDETELEEYKTGFVRCFDLRTGPLYRFAIVRTEKKLYLLTDFHHLVFDGYSLRLFTKELSDGLGGKEPASERFSYYKYISEQKEFEASLEYEENRRYFASMLVDFEKASMVEPDLGGVPEKGYQDSVSVSFDYKKIADYCNSINTTPAALFLGAVSYVVSRYTAEDHVYLSTISSGRGDVRTADTVGMFVNTLALGINIGDETCEDYVRQCFDVLTGAMEHDRYPFARIAADYDFEPNIMFEYQIGMVTSSLKIEPIGLETPKFKLSFCIEDKDGQAYVTLRYNDELYSQEQMQGLSAAVVKAAVSLTASPQAPVRSIELCDEKELLLLDGFNEEAVRPYDDTDTVVSMFRRAVSDHEKRGAVIYDDRVYTYEEVDDISERIAAEILRRGFGRGSVAAILIPRGEYMALASLGSLKAGAAYQPLDSSYPPGRLNYMVKDSDAGILITTRDLRELVTEFEGEVLYLEDIPSLPAPSERVSAEPLPDDLFILLYTSGSTGTPKGVRLTHRNLVCFINWYHRYYELEPVDCVGQYASYGFDACMMDMYPALTKGAAVCIIPEAIRLDLNAVNEYLEKNNVTHQFMTTQIARQFAVNIDNHSLKHLSAGGEKLVSFKPAGNYTFHNGYGPTECTIFTTTYKVMNDEDNIPIGKPLDNLRLYIVDKEFNRLPVGALGELLVTGPQVGDGYMNLPEKSRDVFIDNPFGEGKAYRTGDIVRYRSDGNIEFIGRKDAQVKIRGFRIELTEVEAVIRDFPGVTDATVAAFDHVSGQGKFIAAYVVGDKELDIKAIRHFIGERKPPYMIPASIMQIERIPLNQNQKVNRRALPEPKVERGEIETAINDAERTFCEIFCKVLNLDEVGATEDFFSLGGSSILVTLVLVEAEKAGYKMTYQDIFSHKTPRELAGMFETDTKVYTDSDVYDEVREYDYSILAPVLAANNLKTFKEGERRPLGDIMLTGATGYLGIHVLHELLENHSGRVYCLLRGKKKITARRHLEMLLVYYFNNAYEEAWENRLFVIEGDITGEIPELPVNTVINCAAVVKHFSTGTEIEDVNTGGVMNLTDYCLKKEARFIQVSTMSTVSMFVEAGSLDEKLRNIGEQHLYFGQPLDNKYIRSKFLAERLILEAVSAKGLDAKIMRVGNLAARFSDGEFQVNYGTNSFMGRLRVYSMLGVCPFEQMDELMEFSPIDEVAKVILLLGETPRKNILFHAYDHNMILSANVFKVMAEEGFKITPVEGEAFEKAIREAGEDPVKARLLTSMLAYRSPDTDGRNIAIPWNNSFTMQVLYRMGYRWPQISEEYVKRFIGGMIGLGYFDLK